MENVYNMTAAKAAIARAERMTVNESPEKGLSEESLYSSIFHF
jgi:hypothetical protein